MKKKLRYYALCKLAGPAVILLGLQNCSVANRIYSDIDIVTATKRFELKYNCRDHDRRSPLQYFTQYIIKEVNAENEISYTAWDVLTLPGNSFRPDEKVFLIVNNEVFPMKIKRMEVEDIKSISENTGSIATSDSTSVPVVTGYSENNRKVVRFCYIIPPETMEKIREADRFSLQYYSGPSMITVKPKMRSISRLKDLTERN